MIRLLSGIRVIEVGHIVAGPTVGLLLSGLGAEVIKIERPGEGDISRSMPVTGSSLGTFPFFNRGKKSVTINLQTETGRGIFLKLIEKSDVLVDNLGRSSLERLRLGFQDTQKVNPNLIYLSVKGYGKGPYSERNSLDYPIEVESGIAYMNGLNGRPMRLGSSMVDMTAAMFGVIGILNALLSRREGRKEERHIEIGLFETALFMMGQHIATTQLTGRPMAPLNEVGFSWGIYDFFTTADGQRIFIAVATDSQWKKFCSSLNLEICDNKDYQRNEDRYNNRSKLIPYLQNIISKHSYSDLIRILDQIQGSYAKLNTPSDLLKHPHAVLKMTAISWGGRTIKVPTIPGGEDQPTLNVPDLGGDSVQVLQELGYDRGSIENMRKNGII